MTVKRFKRGRCLRAAAGALALLVAAWPLPARAITANEEEKIGREFMQQAARRLEFVQDPLVTEGVRSVGRRLLAGMPVQPFEYHFYVVKNEALNAFAAPAGQLFVHTGLLTAINSEDELAGILAHEIGHASARHISRNIEQAAVTQGLTLAGIAAGLLLGGIGGAALGQGVAVGALAGGQSATLAYSRAFERQADQLGLAYLQQAGYSGQGLVDGLMTIRRHDYLGGSVPSYLSTHPATAERITWLQAQIGEPPPTARPAIADFKLFQTQAMARYAAADTAEKRFRSQLRQHPDDALAHYGLGVVLARSGQRSEARGHLQAALARQPLNIWMRAALGKVSSQLGDDRTAIDHLSDLWGTAAMSSQVRYYLANSLVNSGRPGEAVAVLKPLARMPVPDARKASREKKPQPPTAPTDPVTAQGFHLLARAFNDLGRPADSHLYLGRYFLAREKTRAAVYHLEKALSLATDSGQRKTIERLLAQTRKGAVRKPGGRRKGKPPAGLST